MRAAFCDLFRCRLAEKEKKIMRIPGFIRDTDTLGFVAPSFGCNMEPYKSSFENALLKLRAKGHGIELGPNVYEGSGTGISASPESCGRELTEGYLSDKSRALISCGGGELMCEILDYVDFERIREAPPKWYMGYSDNTNFTFLLNTLCDTAAVYGPCAPAFGMEPWHPAIEDAYALLRGEKNAFEGYPLFETESLKDAEHPLAPYHVTQPGKIRLYTPDGPGGEPGRLRLCEGGFTQLGGRLIGGCMDILVTLLGTKYDRVRAFNERYADDGILWFLESCDLNVFGIRRALWQMKHAGWFEHVKGFLIGRPYCHGQELMGLDQYRAVTEALAEYGVPVLMDLDIGHLPPMVPVVSGACARVSLSGERFGIEYRL